MRRAGVLVLCLLAGCTSPGGLRVEGPAAPTASVRDTLVLDYAQRPARRPETLWLDEVTALVDLRWSGWDATRAIATGYLVQPYCARAPCLPTAGPDAEPVRLQLDGLVQRGDTRYYSHVSLTPTARPDPAGLVSQYASVHLPVPAR